jgi:glycosyltransferase involved in cell wall biosynthesis
MRIAVFVKSTTFHAGYGGLETQNKLLCEGLVQRGHDISVFSPQKELKSEAKYDGGVKYHFIPCIYRLTSTSKQNWVRRSVEIFKKHHLEKPFDLVISQSSAGLGVILKKHEFNVPAISISHGTIIGEFQTNLKTVSGIKSFFHLLKDGIFVLRVFFGRQRKFIHGSDKIIAVSSAVKKALIDETFVPEEKVVVINNGVDPSVFTSDPSVQDFSQLPKILYVGQITKSKGLDTLFRMAQEPELSQIQFDIIGGGDYLEELKSQVDKAKISDRFILHGKKPYNELTPYLAQLSNAIFAFPTKRYEGFPMVLVEALFLGFPIVAYNVGGVSDAVKNDQTGFLIPPGDYEKFKHGILSLVNNADQRRLFSENGRKFAYNELTITTMLDKYEQIFAEVIEKHENITNSL